MAAHSSLDTFSILQIAGDGEGVNAHVSFVAQNPQQGIISQKARQAARSGSREVHLPEREFLTAAPESADSFRIGRDPCTADWPLRTPWGSKREGIPI